ncbi:MAG: hypothetical protein MRZ79_06700 [Bacteroidia bacterium]|nr:hypothetical protein [Bacteroidia bacterium]
MDKIKGRDIQMKYWIKSAIARKYYESLGRIYDNEAARKQFNQDNIDIQRLIEVMQGTYQEEIEELKKLLENGEK